MKKIALPVLLCSLLCLPSAALAQRRFSLLAGWGGGKPEEICPKAADVGFQEILVWNRDPAYLRHLIEVADGYDLKVYASVYLSDVKGWNKRFPGAPPPLQEMNAEEEAAAKRLEGDRRPGKGRCQFGGEPVSGLEVLTERMLCFHRPEVVSFLKEEIRDALRVERLRGVAFDFFGYRNYRCCRCGHSMERFEEFCAKNRQLSREAALDKFSLDTLVDFNNEMAAYARAVRPAVKVATHVYPVFLPEPLYGNRLDVDLCGQTAAWYFEPFWSMEKIRRYASVIAGEADKHHPRAEGVAMIGIHSDPRKFGLAKTPERVAEELQAILDGGCDKVQVCSMASVLNDEKMAAVFREFFGRR
ncbi:MAG TPA: hypothetical protein VMY37_15880 [Thermoguttaceae bacterium]|nr:hypothetical protein [Thermoguttaceae bacterium]